MSSITPLAAPITADRLPLKPSPPPRSLRLPTAARITAASSPAIRTTATGAVILTALLSSRLSPARADPLPPPPADELTLPETDTDTETPLTRLIDSNPDTLPALRTLLHRHLNDGEDSTALSLLRRLIDAQPSNPEWKFLAARLLVEMGNPAESRNLFEQILAADPLSFEALFENAVLMDQSGEGPAVIARLEQALEMARDDGQEKAARDVRLIIAQIQFLQKNVEEAIASYELLAEEDPTDYRPFFCQGMIYSLLERNEEAREKFAKYRELSPKKFEVDVYEQVGVSRTRLFGTEDSQN